MAKLNRTRSVTSLQPDERNGHKPAVVTQFWGDKSVSLRGTTQGPGKRVVAIDDPLQGKMWYQNIHAIDEKTLKEVKPMIKMKFTPKQKKQLTLDDLLVKFNERRSR